MNSAMSPAAEVFESGDDSRPSSMPTQRVLEDEFTLTKAELSEILYDKVGLNKREAKDMVEAFF